MTCDLVLVGGGLQSALIALAVLERDPSARVAVVERGAALGGDHTWSFHAGDLSPGMARVVAPMVAHRWPAYDVAFPGFTRRIERPYASITAASLHAAVSARLDAAPGARLLLGATADEIGPREVRLASGERLVASLVVDARGPDPRARAGAYQKFLGLELELDRPAAREVPLVMDFRVPQGEGLRFVYVLPLAPDRVLVEDTYYAEDPRLDRARVVARIRSYAGPGIRRVVRAEQGALPLPLAPVPVCAGAAPLVAGYRGGWFHPTTGYSLPAAARLAEAIALAWPAPLGSAQLRELAAAHARQTTFFALLNRLLFRAIPPAERWRALERFHRLPDDTVERFYALRLGARDRARVLVGRPPRGISLGRALLELGGTTSGARDGRR
jgi:lycopene beta-cyclase